MDVLQQYLDRAKETIGDRTPEQVQYDNEVIRWIVRKKNIRKAIAKANEKYPSEALIPTEDTLADIQAHYEYLAEHEKIMQKLQKKDRRTICSGSW
jgi:hypothetical protein